MEMFFTDELRTRLLQLKKKDFTEDAIRRIYLEETGREISAQITLYQPEDYMDDFAINKYVFNASIVHFFNEKSDINQLYYIVRGDVHEEEQTKSLDKWIDHIICFFVGKNIFDFHSAEKFKNIVVQKVEDKTKGSNISLVKIGIGYAFGGNIIQLLQLLTGDFNKVYTVNAVPISVYQLAYFDSDFRQKLFSEFIIQNNDFQQIYTINHERLKDFAAAYYKKSAQRIDHLVAEGNIFQLFLAIRGFFQIGNVHFVANSININPLPELISNIPYVIWKDLQIFFGKYLDYGYQIGANGFFKIMTGLDLTLLDQIIAYDRWADFINIDDIYSEGYEMVQQIGVRLPHFLEVLGRVDQFIEKKGEGIVSKGYLSKQEFVSIVQELKGIKGSFKEMESQAANFLTESLSKRNQESFYLLINSLKKMKGEADHISTKIKRLVELLKPMHDSLKNSFHLLSIQNIVQSIALRKGKRYTKSGELIVIQKSENETIRINVSSAIRIYLKGMEIYDEKEAILKRMKEIYLIEFVEDFEERKRKLIAKIEDMENRPWKYQYLVGNVSPNTNYFYQLKKIHVQEEIYPLDASFQVVFENMFEFYEQEIARGRERINDIRKAIEQLFTADNNAADSIKKAGYG